MRLHQRVESGQATPLEGAEARITLDRLQSKWDLGWIPREILYPESCHRHIPALTPENLDFYDSLFGSDDLLPLIYPPVSSGWGERYGSDEQDWANLRKGTLLISVDVTYPLDLLLSLIEAQIREAIEFRRSLVREPPRPYKRRRSDKAEFYLRGYDLAEQGQTFGAIAKALKRRVSTVKSAFLAARRIIFGSAPVPSKRQLPLVSFDIGNHCQQCSICRTAQRFEDMCPQAQYYANQDYASQRELTGLDTFR
jgi:hypothetical protein